MSSQQNPPQSMGSTNVVFRTETRFDSSYIKSPPGIIKVCVIGPLQRCLRSYGILLSGSAADIEFIFILQQRAILATYLLLEILNLLGFICIQSTAFWSNARGVYFNVVAHLGLWFSGILLLLYLFHVVEKYHNIMWLKIEMMACGIISFLYLIASTIVVAFGSAGYSAAGFFGYLAMVLYGLDAFLKARAMQAGELAQGTKVQTKQTPVTTPTT